MKCPNDDTILTMSDRQGIEIDYCPQCRGVWLDRGELDKIIERSSSPAAATPKPAEYTQHPQQYQQAPQHTSHQNDYHNQHYKKRKKENFLGDLFDF